MYRGRPFYGQSLRRLDSAYSSCEKKNEEHSCLNQQIEETRECEVWVHLGQCSRSMIQAGARSGKPPDQLRYTMQRDPLSLKIVCGAWLLSGRFGAYVGGSQDRIQLQPQSIDLGQLLHSQLPSAPRCVKSDTVSKLYSWKRLGVVGLVDLKMRYRNIRNQ